MLSSTSAEMHEQMSTILDKKMLASIRNPKLGDATVHYIIGKDKTDEAFVNDVAYVMRYQDGWTHFLDNDMSTLFMCLTDAIISVKFSTPIAGCNEGEKE